jgi:hypothetical protein
MNMIYNVVFVKKGQGHVGVFKSFAVPEVDDTVFLNGQEVKIISREFRFSKTNTDTIPVDEVNVILTIE